MDTEKLRAEDIPSGDRRNRMMGLGLPRLVERVQALHVSARLPDDARAQLDRAKQLLLAGFFFYDLFGEALFRTAVAAEIVLGEAYLARSNAPLVLERKARDEHGEPTGGPPLQRPAPSNWVDLDELLHDGWRPPKTRDRDLVPNSFVGLVTWAIDRGVLPAEDKKWWIEAVIPLRNASAHGRTSIMPPGVFIGSMTQLVLRLNAVFPDPALEQHDRELCAMLALRAQQEAAEIQDAISAIERSKATPR